MSNLYYSPEHFGLESVADLEMVGESYQFDLVAVWKNMKHEFFWAQDSGCSCPTPFENHDLTSIERLTKENFEYFADTVRGQCANGIDANDFLRDVEAAMNKPRTKFKLLDYKKPD